MKTAYITLVGSTIEYSSCIWDPHLKKDIAMVEAVQCRAARFVSGNYGRESSVTEMMETLGWQSLPDRRREARLAMLVKVVPPPEGLEQTSNHSRGANPPLSQHR